jgi:hypothetical protein
MFIDPGGARIGIRVYSHAEDIPASALAEVSIREVGIGKHRAIEVSTGNASLYRDFYSFCCSLADRVQLAKQPTARALKETLHSWSSLIRRKVLLSEDGQVGLIGELLFMKRVADSLGWKVAAQAWNGPGSEEHDFSLNKVDVEVKTTRAEKRLHHFGFTQLAPKHNKRLFILSVQLTLAGTAANTYSLPTLIATTLSAAALQSPDAAAGLRHQLDQVGWSDADASFYSTKYELRAPHMAIPVDSRVPAIIPATLAKLGPTQLSRIDRLSYCINLDGLGAADGTRLFRTYLFPR